MSNPRILTSVFAVVAAISGSALAQDTYPTRPITVISPWTAGGVGDISARLIGEPMGKPLGQPPVIDSRAGGGGKIGTEVKWHLLKRIRGFAVRPEPVEG
jgi:tripartite-type tricarboxylate transporter receptor subunit TctC